MEILLSTVSGRFVVEYDDDDPPDPKTRFLVLTSAAKWQFETIGNRPKNVDGIEYDHVVEVDCVEDVVRSSLPREAATILIESVAQVVLGAAKEKRAANGGAADPGDVEEIDVSFEEDS